MCFLSKHYLSHTKISKRNIIETDEHQQCDQRLLGGGRRESGPKEKVGLGSRYLAKPPNLARVEHQVRFLFQHFLRGRPILRRCVSSSASISGLLRNVGAIHNPTIVTAAKKDIVISNHIILFTRNYTNTLLITNKAKI